MRSSLVQGYVALGAEPEVVKWCVQLGLKLDIGSQTFCWKNYLKTFFFISADCSQKRFNQMRMFLSHREFSKNVAFH